MKLIRMAGVTISLSVALLLTGCGDTYRPIVTPFPTPGGDPQAARTAFVLNQGVSQPGTSLCADGSSAPCAGSVTQIDVPGDTNMGNRVQGREPWHAQIGSNAASLYVANRDSDTITYFPPFLSASTTTTISLPPGSAPVFVNSTDSTVMYVAESGTNKVAVISTASSQLSQEIPVGTRPVSLAETPDRSHLYVVNKGSSNVTVIATLDKKVLGTIPVGTSPVWAIATPDSKFIFVLNRGSNSISVISTSNNQTELGEFSVGASADVDMPLDNPMYFDSKAQRLYVVNSTSNSVSVFDTSGLALSTPALPTEIKPQSPIALPDGSGPVSVAALSDGSRIYTANMGSGTVSIIDARSLALKSTITLGSPVVAVAASPDASKVYAAVPNAITDQSGKLIQPPGTAVINTANDTPVVVNGTPITIPAPFQDPVNCVSDAPLTWAANTGFILNAVVSPTTPNGHFYRATTAGTSGGTEPQWCTTSGCTVNDGTVVWTEIGATAPACPRQSPSWVLTSTP